MKINHRGTLNLPIPKTILASVTALILCLAPQAKADVVLYGFNGGGFDSWFANPVHGASGFTSSYATPLPQVTEGDSAGGFLGGNWYEGGSELLSPTTTSFSGAFSALVGNTQIGIDFTQLDLSPGFQNYSFNLTISGTDHLGAAFSTQIQLRDFNGATPTTLSYDYSAVAGGDIANGTAQSFTFGLTTYGAGGLTVNPGVNNHLAMDNMRVIGAVPEPSAWALLGFGLVGLVYLRRRQKLGA